MTELTKIPHFSAPASTGQTIEAASYIGKLPLVLVFCAEEPVLRAFDDALSDFGNARSQPLAILEATARTVRDMAEGMDLNLPLLADPVDAIRAEFGVTSDCVVVADAAGVVQHVFDLGGDPGDTVAKALDAVSEMETPLSA
ncbi:MAG: redoxin domain-containing protein [Acidimicrobiia bacterium]|nr:redoxin domain-containing protein [Acidimicrobiia bacterium]